MRTSKTLLLASLVAVAGACESFEDLGTNPNAATEVNPSLLLTSIEVDVFNQVSTTAALASRHVVFTDGVSAYQYYAWQHGDYEEYQTLRSVMKMIEEAERVGAPGYVALGRFFRAFLFYQLTQRFGDVPYREALQGDAGTFTPAYDPQAEVFAGILEELEQANAMLASGGGEILGDVVYGGDVRQWRKLINSFRLRVLMSLSARAGAGEIDVAGEFARIVNDPARYPLLASNEDNAQLVFVDRDGNRYPLYNDRSVQTAFFMERSFVQMLKDRSDPRLFRFAAPERRAVEAGVPGYERDFGSYGGLDAGAHVGENVQRVADLGEGSPLHPRYHSDPVNEPSVALGYPEVEFLLAEAAARGWTGGDARAHYEAGIRASMKFYGLADAEVAAYLAGPLVAYDPARAIEQISVQKHIAFFLNSGWEPFYNQRRTGHPAFAVGPATQNGGRVPKRWMYPQSELDYNGANVTAAVQRQYGADDVNGEMWALKP